MSTAIRLKRNGRKKSAFYRIIVIDSREKRDGRAIEDLGWFNPHTDKISLKQKRYQHWLKIGAQVSLRVASIAKKNSSDNSIAA
ncbi:MAG: 30S ribosomal protein S16 [Candidatus Caenarcaniphilales bacterium]|nr:30S ribosomal protein S16 [Candidatus Caenarcaniphilales bacterium]